MQLPLLAAAALALVPHALARQAPTLKAGDPAPPLSIERWVKGAAVPAFTPGEVYVVEFWATWCGPCIRGMPHLTRLQEKMRPKGVTIIGVTARDPNNSLEDVETFVETNAAIMGYTVAWDAGTATLDAYLRAAGRTGIPCCFLVDRRGALAWVGHPLFLPHPLERVLAGAWDVTEGAREVARIEERLFGGVFAKARTAPETALENLLAFERDHPRIAAQVADMRFQLLLQAKRYDEAYATGAALVDALIADGNWSGLNELAWTIVDPAGDVATKDLALARKAAAKGVELSKRKHPAILDTLARVHFVAGELDAAIAVQEEAVALAAAGALRESLQAALAEYRAAREEQKR